MKALFFAVLLTVMQAVPPVPSKVPDANTHSSKTATKNTKGSQKPTASLPPTTNNSVEPEPKENTSKPVENSGNSKPVVIGKLPSVSVQRDWIDWVALTFTGLLVLLGIGGVCAALRTLQAIEKQANALINSERAWVIAELVPVCLKFGMSWHRPTGDGWAALSDKEILNGDHMRHKLKFTNMGRTPAHILRYQMGYSREVDPTDLHVIDATKRPETVFDRLLPGNEWVEPENVDVFQYIRDSIKAIGDSKTAGIFSGWVEYQHVFSEVDVVSVPFAYLYEPSSQRLRRIRVRKTEKGKEKKQSPN